MLAGVSARSRAVHCAPCAAGGFCVCGGCGCSGVVPFWGAVGRGARWVQFGVRVLRKWCSFTNSGRFGACFGRLFAKLRHLRDLFRLAHPGSPRTRPEHTTHTHHPHASPAPDLDTARGLFYPYPRWRVRAAEGERLESVCWVTPNRGFESRRHRHFSSRSLNQGSAFLISTTVLASSIGLIMTVACAHPHLRTLHVQNRNVLAAAARVRRTTWQSFCTGWDYSRFAIAGA